jgi:Putative restriction endonuclease
MIEAGVIGDDENFELIEGDLVVMAAKHLGRDGIKNALDMALARRAPEGVYVAIKCTLQLANDILVEPDIAIVSQAVYASDPKSFARPRPRETCAS